MLRLTIFPENIERQKTRIGLYKTTIRLQLEFNSAGGS